MTEGVVNMKINPKDQHLLTVYDDAEKLRCHVKAMSLSEELNEIDERYQIGELLGEGAVKRVYKAYDCVMDRVVAYATLKEGRDELKGLLR